MAKPTSISSIFSGFGVPKHTYVAQEGGAFEKQLRGGIKEAGTLCLITGSSKTGKTTLYNRVLQDLGSSPLLIRCDATVNSEEFWKRPLEIVDFSRLRETIDSSSIETQATAKLGGKIGWKWLAEMIGEVSLGIKGTRSEQQIREAILSKPSPSHIVPLLKHSNAILVVEDFHYLDSSVQKHIFQQWKTFCDEEISIIVVGTTHHGVDLAYANPDLIGRIQQIDLKRWPRGDLKKIAEKGFQELKIEIKPSIITLIADESVGLPIITQQTCGQLFFDKNIEEVSAGFEMQIAKQAAYDSLHHVAINRYKQFESWYRRLITGPRKSARKYNTYEIVLAAFALDPLQFELSRHEIDLRISRLPIRDETRPPTASVNSTLTALAKFQDSHGFELLEWSKRDKTLFVLEPAFLFYLRWRVSRDKPTGILDLLEELPNLRKLLGFPLEPAHKHEKPR